MALGRWLGFGVLGLAALVTAACATSDRSFVPDGVFYDAGSGGAGASGGVGGSSGSDGGGATGGVGGNIGGAAGSDAGSNPCDEVVCNTPPQNTCEDPTGLTVYATDGVCDATGKCVYSHQRLDCPNGCANDACVGDPCLGVSCSTPPAKKCADATSLTVYDAPGTCANGTCSYSSHVQPCSFGCANDACTGDPCAGVSCTTPPSAYCVDAFTRRSFGNGVCSQGNCTYSPTDTTCQFGCAAGVCSGDPCAGVTCNKPPAAYCVDASTKRTFANPGSCAGGNCTYAPTDSTCQYGCANGACNAVDPCQGVTCNSPPPASCVSGTTLRTYALPGTCSQGSCTYAYTDQACPGGCTGSTCLACSTASQCAANQWCSAGTCTACSSAACGDGVCDCGETTASCAGDCGPPCPTGLVIGSWNSGDDGWTKDGLWRRDSSGYMVAGSTTSYNSSYTQNLTYPTNVDLSSCATATLGFSVKLSDDATWSPDADKSERLYVQCSGDAGANWTNLTPNPWPANQSACATSYCDGDLGLDRSFNWTAQTITLPAACRTATTRFRFQAKGSSVWRLQNPGWYVDSVGIN